MTYSEALAESGVCRKTCLHEGFGLDVTLTVYEPGLCMPLHDHEKHQVSYLLAGEMQEDVGNSQKDVYTVARGVKPSGCVHADFIGPNGALILSINFQDDAFETQISGLRWGWQAYVARGADSGNDAALISLLRCSDRSQKSDLAWDLISSNHCVAANDQEPILPWLHQVRDMIGDEPERVDLAGAASEVGVHPVHLSRAFKKAFGLPPSLYRSRVRVARGVQEVLSGRSLAEASAAAGFADQSHFTRTLQKEMGLSPKRLQGLFR